MNQKITLPTLYPQQKEILNHTARFKILVCGRRFGKTKLAITYLGEARLHADNRELYRQNTKNRRKSPVIAKKQVNIPLTIGPQHAKQKGLVSHQTLPDTTQPVA